MKLTAMILLVLVIAYWTSDDKSNEHHDPAHTQDD